MKSNCGHRTCLQQQGVPKSLLGWSLAGRAVCSGRRGRGRGCLSSERRLVTLNWAILITGESRRCSTLVVVHNCTMEVNLFPLE